MVPTAALCTECTQSLLKSQVFFSAIGTISSPFSTVNLAMLCVPCYTTKTRIFVQEGGENDGCATTRYERTCMG